MAKTSARARARRRDMLSQAGVTVADRIAAGKACRKRVPRSAHAGWAAPKNRRDPITLLEEADRGRLRDLLPIRYGRMVASPFGFLRGAGAVMANDVSTTPSTGLKLQVCGDAHLANFGAYVTPERNLIFGINDFDETLPAPWEWDVKRLCASIVVAGRTLGVGPKVCKKAAAAAICTYRERVTVYCTMDPLVVWFERAQMKMVSHLIQCGHCADFRANPGEAIHSYEARTLPQLTKLVRGKRRIVDDPPLIVHPTKGGDALIERTRQSFLTYQRTLRNDVRVLFDRYRFVDSAVKVVGVGSVGTRCGIALFMADDYPLFLQIKEAVPSVLEPYAGASTYDNQGERVVAGQRLLQAESDMFLGWIRREDGRDFYIRLLRDLKSSAHVDHMNAEDLVEYGGLCGWALARAHARAGDAAFISGYLGKKDIFDRAIVEFACDYADQNERDYDTLVAAVKAGRIKAQT